MREAGTGKKVLAAVHAAPVFMQTDATIDKVVDFIREGGRQGVRFMVFPEVFVPGYPHWLNGYSPSAAVEANVRYASASVEAPGPEISRVQEACRGAKVATALGVSERMPGARTCFNTQVFIDSDGAYLGKHRKLAPTYAEKMVWAQGSGATLRLFRSRIGVVGGLVCSENVLCGAWQTYIDQHQQIHASAWPAISAQRGRANFDDVIESMARSHAYGAQVFVITSSSFVSQDIMAWMTENLGPPDHLQLGGSWSAITHPYSTHLAGPASGVGDRLLVAEADLGDLDRGWLLLDGAGHCARPEVVRTQIKSHPIWADEVASGLSDSDRTQDAPPGSDISPSETA